MNNSRENAITATAKRAGTRAYPIEGTRRFARCACVAPDPARHRPQPPPVADSRRPTVVPGTSGA